MDIMKTLMPPEEQFRSSILFVHVFLSRLPADIHGHCVPFAQLDRGPSLPGARTCSSSLDPLSRPRNSRQMQPRTRGPRSLTLAASSPLRSSTTSRSTRKPTQPMCSRAKISQFGWPTCRFSHSFRCPGSRLGTNKDEAGRSTN